MPKPDKLAEAVMKANKRAVSESSARKSKSAAKAKITQAEGRPRGGFYGGMTRSKGK
jgi:hypothetical protein